MHKREKLDELFAENEYITTAEVESMGISRQYFMDYVSSKDMVKVTKGIYMSGEAWQDPLYEISLRFKESVFSYETALMLWKLTEREPFRNAVTVRKGYNATGLRKMNVEVHNVASELFDLGLTSKQTAFGHEVRVYDMERTICDIVKAKEKTDIQTFQYAVTGYMRRKDKDINKLMEYAGKMRCEEKIRNYAEVLIL